MDSAEEFYDTQAYFIFMRNGGKSYLKYVQT